MFSLIFHRIVSIGAVFALCTSLIGAMFPLPRILYAMSSDGLLYAVFRCVNERTKTPLNATLISGAIAAVMALIFDLNQLIDMMSIGTLMAYTIVAICIVVLRYQEDQDIVTGSYMDEISSTPSQILRQIFNLNFIKWPNALSSNITKITVFLFCVASVIFSALIDTQWKTFSSVHVCLIIAAICMILFYVIIARQPMFECELSFKVPAVPFIPLLSIFINLYLMFQLDINTWIRFFIWLAIGYIIYFTYGIWRSVEGNREKLELNEHKQIYRNAEEGNCTEQSVSECTIQSTVDLRNVNSNLS